MNTRREPFVLKASSLQVGFDAIRDNVATESRVHPTDRRWPRVKWTAEAPVIVDCGRALRHPGGIQHRLRQEARLIWTEREC